MRRIVFAAVMMAVAFLAFPDLGVQAAEDNINRRLFAAVRANDFGAVRRIIGEGADPFVFNDQGAAPVDIAVDKGFFDIAHYLLAVQNQRSESGRTATKEVPPLSPPLLPVVTPAPVQAVTVSEPALLVRTPPISPAATPSEPVPAIAPQTVQMVNEVEPRAELPPETPPTTNTSPETAQSKEAVSRTVAAEPVPAVVEEPQSMANSSDGQADDTGTPLFGRLLDYLKGDETPEPDLPGEVDDPVSTKEQAAISTLTSAEPAEIYRAPPPPKPLMNTLTQQIVTEPAAPAASPQVTESVQSEPPEPPEPSEPKPAELSSKIEPEPIAVAASEPVGSPESLQPAPAGEAEALDQPESPTAFEHIVNFLKGEPSDASNVATQPTSIEKVAEPRGVTPVQPRMNELSQSIVQSKDAPEISESQTPLVSEPTPTIDMVPVAEVSETVTDNPPVISPEPVVDSATLFDQVVGFFTPDQPTQNAAPKQPSSVSGEATLPIAVDVDPSSEEIVVRTPPAKPQAPVANAKPVPPRVSPPSPADMTVPPTNFVLRADHMVFGETGRLGKKLGGDRVGSRDCIRKPAWGSSICIENIDWPEEVREAFGNLSYYAGGGRAIVRYVEAKATQYHVLFPASSFSQLAQYFKRKFGPPSETPEIWTSMLGEPKRFNKTFRWRAPGKDGSGFLMVEMREIDDLRWSAPPDEHHGVVRLYREGAKPVFELLTTADLLLMQVRKGRYQEDIPPGDRPKG